MEEADEALLNYFWTCGFVIAKISVIVRCLVKKLLVRIELGNLAGFGHPCVLCSI